MSNEEQVADTIEMLYERLNSYNKQDLFNYGYLLESNEILCKDIEEKDREIDRLNNIINKIIEWLDDYNNRCTDDLYAEACIEAKEELIRLKEVKE